VSNVSSGIAVDGIKTKLNFQILSYPLIDIARNSIRMEFVKKIVYDKGKYNECLDTSKLVGKNTPATFIWHSKKDIIVPYDHSLKYIESLEKRNIEYLSRIYPDGNHGIGLGFKNKKSHPLISNWSNECREWLQLINIIQ
jgi:mRNA deadenylase 3'-5' endonuclease subunit Ccr4